MIVTFFDINLVLSPGLEAPSVARKSLWKLKDRVDEENLEDLKLVVTELVTNSVRHGSPSLGDEIQFELRVYEDVIRGEVTDAGPGFEKPAFDEEPLFPLDETGASGWGLYMIERITARWGVERGECTRVWFEIEDQSDGIRALD